MAVRSTRFVIGDHTASGGVDVLYTVPADRTAIVKDVSVRDLGSGATPILMTKSSGGSFGVIFEATLAANAWKRADPPPWQVLHEGDQVVWFAAATHGVRWLISGTLLLGDSS